MDYRSYLLVFSVQLSLVRLITEVIPSAWICASAKCVRSEQVGMYWVDSSGLLCWVWRAVGNTKYARGYNLAYRALCQTRPNGYSEM